MEYILNISTYILKKHAKYLGDISFWDRKKRQVLEKTKGVFDVVGIDLFIT